jgi:hypothetical protein
MHRSSTRLEPSPLIRRRWGAGLIVVTWLDRLRSHLLRRTMIYHSLRSLYVLRSRRLGAQYLVSFTLSLALAMKFPLWLLVWGPIFYGLPHLVSSFRYCAVLSGIGRTPAKLFSGLVGISLIIAAFRIGTTCVIGGSNFPELAGLCLVVLGLSFTGKFHWLRAGRALLFVCPLFYFAFASPLAMLGLLMLGHNFVGFFYWIRQSRTPDDRFVATVAFVLFCGAHLWFFKGPLPTIGWSFAGLNVWQLGNQIFPSAGVVPNLWARAVVAYAFGQSVHYFIWLRAIPEQDLVTGTPTSFSQSLYWLQKDLGRRGAWYTIALILALSLGWCLFRYPTARFLYLAIASFHGYSELAGLFMAGVRTVDTCRAPFLRQWRFISFTPRVSPKFVTSS